MLQFYDKLKIQASCLAGEVSLEPLGIYLSFFSELSSSELSELWFSKSTILFGEIYIYFASV